MRRLQQVLLLAVVANAVVALVFRANGTPMPAWFAAILVTASLALVWVRLAGRGAAGTSRASDM